MDPGVWSLESGVLPTSSDRIDVHRRSHQSRWKPSSTGVITLTFQKLIWTCSHNFTPTFFILKHLLCYLDGKTFGKLRVENHFSTEKRMEIKSCVKRQKVTVVWCVLFLWLTGHNSDETVHTEGSAQNQLFLVIKIGLRSYCGAWRPQFDPGFASSLPVSVSCHSSWNCTITVGLWFNLNWP